MDSTTTKLSRFPITFLLPNELPACEDVSLVCRMTANEQVTIVTKYVPLPQRVQLIAYLESSYLVVGLQCGLYFQARNKYGGTTNRQSFAWLDRDLMFM